MCLVRGRILRSIVTCMCVVSERVVWGNRSLDMVCFLQGCVRVAAFNFFFNEKVGIKQEIVRTQVMATNLPVRHYEQVARVIPQVLWIIYLTIHENEGKEFAHMEWHGPLAGLVQTAVPLSVVKHEAQFLCSHVKGVAYVASSFAAM